ncbi:hypothetical protein F442_01411 [Phytophthora nicotianae P10297]|uniref:RxLR effector protein n=2 Tax=Phytophthora nicotianae TaxID=4792 RepID=W3A2E3_PHYNI|nr:hypothetical protein F442_01411 [Phytophthora nicotianae P10297]
MTTSAFVSPDQARPFRINHNTAMGDTRYLREETIDEDEERGLSFLNTLTKELMDDILKTKEAQRNFFASLKGLPVESVAQKILELAPHDEKYLTIALLYKQFRNGEPLSAIYKHNPLEFARANNDYPAWRAYVLSLLKD